MQICRRFIVAGKVQGVFYRDSTRQQAQSLDLSGFVKNLADGRVEVEACGEQDQLDDLQQWLWKGSIMSHVIDVQIQKIPTVNYSLFSIE